MVFGSGYGEPMVVILEPSDAEGRPIKGSKAGVVKFVPHPLKIANRNHCLTLSCEDVEGQFFLIELTGFKPNEIVHLKSNSCDEAMENTFTVDEQGKMLISYSPAVIGKKEGAFFLKIYNENTDLTVNHFWGKIAFTDVRRYSTLKEKYPGPATE